MRDTRCLSGLPTYPAVFSVAGCWLVGVNGNLPACSACQQEEYAIRFEINPHSLSVPTTRPSLGFEFLNPNIWSDSWVCFLREFQLSLRLRSHFFLVVSLLAGFSHFYMLAILVASSSWTIMKNIYGLSSGLLNSVFLHYFSNVLPISGSESLKISTNLAFSFHLKWGKIWQANNLWWPFYWILYQF